METQEVPPVIKPVKAKKTRPRPDEGSTEFLNDRPKKKVKKTTWQKVVIILVSLYIGWSISKINDQAQELHDLKMLISVEVSKTADPSAYTDTWTNPRSKHAL